MSHLISEVSGKPEFAYRNMPAWHGLGEKATTYEEFKQAIGYNVEIVPNLINVGGKEYETGSFSTVRYRPDGSPVILGNRLGGKYNVVQNLEAMDVFEAMEGHAACETVGAIKDGQVAFACFKPNHKIIVGGNDITEMYICFVNSFNGSTGIYVIFTPIRVVCNNTLTAALYGAKNKMSIRHTSSAKDRLQVVANTVTRSAEICERLTPQFVNMAGIQVNPIDVIGQVYFTPAELKALEEGTFEVKNDRRKNLVTGALTWMEKGAGQDMPTTKGTLFGAMNGILGYHQELVAGTDNAMLQAIGMNQSFDSYAEKVSIATKVLPNAQREAITNFLFN